MLHVSDFENITRIDPGEVTTSIQAKDRSAVIVWRLKSEEACTGVVSYYTIVCSTQTGTHFSESVSETGAWTGDASFTHIFAAVFFPDVTVDSTKQDVLLENLTPDTTYSIYVVASALTGTSVSEEKLFKTKRFGECSLQGLSVVRSRSLSRP